MRRSCYNIKNLYSFIHKRKHNFWFYEHNGGMENDLFCKLLSDFVERLKELMEDHNTTVNLLSQQIEVSAPAVYQYLEKKHLPRVGTLIKIADYFSCSMDFLLGLKEQNNSDTFQPCPPFYKRFPYLVECFGESKYSISKRLDISPSLIYYWQTGQRIPTAEHLVLLAKEFHYSIDFILGRES